MTDNHVANSVALARRFLAEHPEEDRSTDVAASATVESGLRCRVEGPGGATVFTDMVTGVGGGATAPSPGWLLRAAHAACDATLIALRAAEVGVEVQEVEVVVDSESDDRGLLGLDDCVPAGPISTRVAVRLTAPGVEPAVLRELVDWAEAHSPVGDALRRGVPVSLDVTTVTDGAPS